MAEQFAYGIDQAREALGGIGRATIYALIESGEIKTFRLKNRRLISAQALAEFVRRREQDPEYEGPCFPIVERDTCPWCGKPIDTTDKGT